MPESKPSGLVGASGPIPLEGVLIEAEIKDFAVKQTLTQRYRNTETHPVEAIYVFPLDEGSAVCGFEAVVGGVHITGEVQEKEAAFEAYDRAISEGHGAYLLDQEKPDVFTASVGNLPPGAEVLIRIMTVAELSLEGEDIRFTVPTVVAPRYAPSEDRKGVGKTVAEAVNPPVAWSVPYGLELRVALEMGSAIKGLESPTHPISFDLDGKRATVQLGERAAALDRDFVLKIRLSDPFKPSAFIEKGPGGEHAALIAFRPHFDESDAEKARAELIFLVDRSGSMDGTSIAEARNALQLCLRSLREGIDFNIAGFGSTHELLFPESRPYGDDSLKEASQHVKFMLADMGGTEILPALEAIFKKEPRPGCPRQLFVLTDGEVSNTEAVIALVRKHSASTRVFTFGIGAGASQHLVKGMARAGEGEAEFIAPGERMEGKVMRQLARALTPSLSDVTVNWGGLSVRQAPHRVPPVFEGGRLLVYGFLKEVKNTTVTLEAKGPAGTITFPVTLDVSGSREEALITTLAARTLIRDLEEGGSPLHTRRGSLQGRQRAEAKVSPEDELKTEIIKLGVQYHLVSRHTSFVAIEKRANPVTGEMQLRKVPVALAKGWGGMDKIEPPVHMAQFGSGSLPPMSPPGFAAFAAAPAPMAKSPSPAPKRSAPPSPPPPPAAAPLADVDFDALCCESEEEDRFSPEPQPERLLDALVSLQRADGSWELDGDLARATGTVLSELKAAIANEKDQKLAAKALATALALIWLEKKAPGQKDEWRLLARKAEGWLAKQVRPSSGSSWKEMAEKLMK